MDYKKQIGRLLDKCPTDTVIWYRQQLESLLMEQETMDRLQAMRGAASPDLIGDILPLCDR